MTLVLVTVLGFLAVYAIYIATMNARALAQPQDFLDGGRSLPAWSYMFAGAGIMIAGLGLHDHLLLAARFGLQYSHVALGLVVAAMASAIVQKRFRIAALVTGMTTPGALLGTYFNSLTIRLFVVLIACLFGLPFAAGKLADLGGILSEATGGAASRQSVILIAGFFLFLTSAIGGWRGIVLTVGAFSFLMIVGLLFMGGFSAATLDKLVFISGGIATAKDTLADQIPGVMQYSRGVGKDLAQGGIWTALAIFSFSFSLIGLVVSPAMLFLGNTTGTRSGFAFKQVWMVAGIAAGSLLLLTPFLAAEIAETGKGYQGLVDRLASVDTALGICAVVLVVAASQIVIAFFASSAAMLVTSDVVHPFVLPDMTPEGRRLAARIALAVFYLGLCWMAAFSPMSAAVLTSVTLSLSAQLLPAILALCWISWISRSAVICGLILGSIMTIFTEPLGLLLFEAPFVDLPWGRWPLTIHSAAWGLVFNVAAVLLVSIFTRAGEERARRDSLHRQFAANSPTEHGRRSLSTAKWSLALIWAFLALGPGAVLGNTFFSEAIFTTGETTLGVPSLWVWQLFFWFFGVLLIWWIAYRGELSVAGDGPMNRLTFSTGPQDALAQRTPNWIEQGLARIAGQRRRR